MALTLLTIGKCVFAVLAVGVGGRLVAELRRGRRSGESGLGLHALALSAIVCGGLGLLLLPIGDALGRPPLIVVGEVAIRAGLLALCLFLTRTFRPGRASGHVIAIGCAISLLGSMGWDLVGQPSLVDYDYTRASSHANQAAIALVFLWATFECGSAWRAGRRRLALGLIEAAVVRSFRLFSIATGALACIGLFAILAGIAEGLGALGFARGLHAARGLLYLVVAASVWQGLFRSAGSESETTAETAA